MAICNALTWKNPTVKSHKISTGGVCGHKKYVSKSEINKHYAAGLS